LSSEGLTAGRKAFVLLLKSRFGIKRSSFFGKTAVCVGVVACIGEAPMIPVL
jgi:hypothetical protein